VYQTFPEPGFNPSRTGTDVVVTAGLGAQWDLGYPYLRAEAGVRVDTDDESFYQDDNFVDYYMGFEFIFPIGPEAAPAAPPPPPPQKTCADLDDDGDGVNNCDDKCPGSQAGQAIGPDGCPVPLTIDLKGVNFDFDKATLRPDAVAILDEAIAILGKYPDLKVEVAGHTDSIGTEQYNQGLSERRAQTVYDYLTGHGIDAGRLVGPNGYGESRPIAPNTNEDGSDNPEGRAKNRRTELNVQN
jgi:OOP family OmpA-OmpF porin